MIPNKDLTQEEAKWIIENFTPTVREGRLDGNTITNYFAKVRSLILGRKVDRPGCACQFKSFAAMTKGLFGQHHEEIKAIAYPPTKTKKRGRKRKTV